ncbi:ribosome maturation factor RimP [Helicobacter turcicus]|uniref:Ribosome maturation factor RimP n=1 Tax=Helicobacter turcicus TaxID=2867412 RepID=A0ABS7JPU3_9HELI|nr:ribosome maturation factor RimP [Helicobacter turcicus]MBX7491404.1 ribosome maturation factor RimP [Helicobacter turcicus]MBX7546271.1 ribosome maturation factor RimP [Helicobacter turcicus]
MTLSPSLEEKIKILVESLGFGLYDILSLKENENQILRICITKQDTSNVESQKVSLDDCQEVSLALSPLLDVEMPDFEKYYLEVSSPGIERVLKTFEHYKGAINELVKIKTFQEIEGKKEFKGRLVSVDESVLVLGNDVKIPLNAIKKAQTYFKW